jgi:hypothetical protein
MHARVLWCLIGFEFIAIFLLQPAKDQFRKLRKYDWKNWVVLYIALTAVWAAKKIIEP